MCVCVVCLNNVNFRLNFVCACVSVCVCVSCVCVGLLCEGLKFVFYERILVSFTYVGSVSTSAPAE